MKKYLLICSLFGLAGNNCLAMKIVKSEKNIKNKNNASILDVLPPEIIVDILEKTDVQTVGRAARTCKTMRALAVPVLKTIAEPNRLNATLVKEACAEGRNDSGAINYLLSLGARLDISEVENALARVTVTTMFHGIVISTKSIIFSTADNKGTPLHGAAVYGNEYLAQLALEKGILIDTVDKSGYTPLHYAVIHVRENINMVRFLLDKGANPNIRGAMLTPLHSAAELGHANIARLLLEKNADVNTTDLFGRTPLQAAEQNHHENVVLLLKSFQKK